MHTPGDDSPHIVTRLITDGDARRIPRRMKSVTVRYFRISSIPASLARELPWTWRSFFQIGVDTMRAVSSIIFAVMLLALTPSASQAQERLWHVNFGGGPTFNMGDLGDNFGTGWGPAIGVTFDAPSHRVAFQFEYAYRWFNVNDELPIGATRFSANHQTHQLAFNFIGNMTAPDSPVRVYGIAGPGHVLSQG